MKKSSLISLSCVLFMCFISGFCTDFVITDYGAIGDGNHDDTPAFLTTWRLVCGSPQPNATLVVPSGKSFLLKPIEFKGPCISDSVRFRIMGELVAPNRKWVMETYGAWINFNTIDNLIVNGGGTIHGRGSIWWDCLKYKVNNCTDIDRPNALHFNNCDGLELSDLTHKDGPKSHISINNVKGAKVFGLNIQAPDESPNTDGIDIVASSNIDTHDSTIGTGDDCIAINSGTSFVNITRLNCGPGHGISVGSLGKGGEYATAEEIHVKNCEIHDTQNGVRIKTYPGGKGYVRKISFEDITFTNSEKPIIIDQFYGNEESNSGGLKISDVSYRNLRGTSADEEGIILECNELGCSNIYMENINIVVAAQVNKKAIATCQHVEGRAIETSPWVSCLAAA